MTRVSISSAAALLMTAAAALPATAADMSGRAPGGIKDYSRGAVPVPAPAPYEEHFRWYLRGDLGGAITARRPTMAESGLSYGAGDIASPLVASNFAGTDFSDLGGMPLTIGAGAHFSRRFRMDLTADYRGETTAQQQGNYNYVTNLNPSISGTSVGTVVNGSLSDALRTSATVTMLNAYWDFNERGRIKPYIGAGLGAAYHRWQREITSADSTGYITGASNTGGALSLAGNMMAGFTYSLSQTTLLDINYRLQYIQGYDISTPMAGIRLASGVTGAADSRMTVGDLWEHQLRAGLRVNLW